MRTKADTPGRRPKWGVQAGLRRSKCSWEKGQRDLWRRHAHHHFQTLPLSLAQDCWMAPSPKAALGDPSGGPWVPGSLEGALHTGWSRQDFMLLHCAGPGLGIDWFGLN